MLALRLRRRLALPLVSLFLTATVLYGAGCGDDDTGTPSSSGVIVLPAAEGGVDSAAADGSKVIPETGSPIDASVADTSTDAADAATGPKFSIGGTVSGLGFGNAVTLELNGATDLTVDLDGKFTFPPTAKIATGASYAVTVKTNPPNKTCTVSAGSGTVADSNITSIVVNCASGTFTLGGTLAGLASGGSVVLTNNGSDDITLSSNNTFAFPTPLLSGAPYAVTVKTQPQNPVQNCVVNKGSGSIPNADVSNVSVLCTTTALPVTANVTNLNAGTNGGGTGVVTLRVVGTANGNPVNQAFAIDQSGVNPLTSLDSGTTYTVSVESSPGYSATPPVSAKQICSITSGGTGTIGATSPEVAVKCVRATAPLGGALIGLGASALIKVQLTYQGIGADGLPAAGQVLNQTLNANGSFTFTGASLASNTPFTVTVTQQPLSPAQQCVITSPTAGKGTATGQGDQGTAVSINCTTDRIPVGGQITGLDFGGCTPPNVNPDGAPSGDVINAACGVRLKIVSTNPASDSVQNFISSGSFQFTRPLGSTEQYLVSVDAQPLYSASQTGSRQHTCTITSPVNGTVGTTPTGNLSDLNVQCQVTPYTVTGDIAGNVAGSGLTLHIAPTTISAAQSVSLNAGESTFSFPNIPSGDTFSVSLENATGGTTTGSHPLTCTVSSGSGIIGNSAPGAVHVVCTEPKLKPIVQFLASGTSMGLTLTCTGGGCPGPQVVTVNGNDGAQTVTGFTSAMPNGTTYGLTISTPPTSTNGLTQTCVVLNGSGTINTSTAISSLTGPDVFPPTVGGGPVVLCSVGATCDAIKAVTPSLANGFYPLDIDGAGATLPAKIYCDYTTDAVPGTSYSYLHVTNGLSSNSTAAPTSCLSGYELAVPRTHPHLDTMLSLFGSSFPNGGFSTDTASFGIVRSGGGGGGENYASCPMTSSTPPGMNCNGGNTITDWHPLSGTRWFLRDVADTLEPSGPYNLNAWLGLFGIDSHGVKVDDAYDFYFTGPDYICTKSNDKNAN